MFTFRCFWQIRADLWEVDSDHCRRDNLLRYRLFAEDLIETQTDLAGTEQRDGVCVGSTRRPERGSLEMEIF